MEFVVASNNVHKVRELALIYQNSFSISISSYLDKIEKLSFPEESEDDLADNALQKALFLSKYLPDQYILSDDTGLFFHAFPNEFGITTARDFTKKNWKNDKEINQGLIDMYRSTTDRTLTAKSIQVLLPLNKKKPLIGIGEIQLKITNQLPENHSQGLDQIFMPIDSNKTVAQLPDKEKMQFSHRFLAAQSIIKEYKKLI